MDTFIRKPVCPDCESENWAVRHEITHEWVGGKEKEKKVAVSVCLDCGLVWA